LSRGISKSGLVLLFPHGLSISGYPLIQLICGTLGEARITFRPGDERIIVTRSSSTQIRDIITEPMHGKHTLFRTTAGLEPLHLRLFFDTSLLEVFANDRIALSTHLYGEDCSVAPFSIP